MDKRERLEVEIDLLKAQLTECFQERLYTDDPVKKVTLGNKEKQLEKELEEKERELAQLPNNKVSENRKTLNLNKGLCEIDFDDAKEIIHAVVDTLTESEGGAALLLMEQCLDLEGRLLLNSLRDILKSSTDQVLEYPVEFSLIMPANERSFLKILGGHFNLSFNEEPNLDSENGLENMIKEILSSISPLLRSGTTILIPLKNWKSLGQNYQADFLDWLVNKFWSLLQQTLSVAMEEYSPRVVFVIMVDAEMASNCQAVKCFYDKLPLNSTKILKLPLTCWSQADIRRWLGSYSSKLKKSERNQLVKSIFNEKDAELPSRIRLALESAHKQAVF